MAFGAEELRVLRRALALALHPGPVSAEDVQDCHRLAESLDEAMCEAARLRAFLVADLARYRAALPGTAAGYLTLLGEVLGAGHRPDPDDLAALRALRGNPVAAALLDRCRTLAEQGVRVRLARRTARRAAPAASIVAPAVPTSRTRLLALPGGRSGEGCDRLSVLVEGAGESPGEEPRRKPAEKPAAPAPGPVPVKPADPQPARRPVPTPGEVFPRRKPAPQPADPEQRQRLAAG
ncbi:hypothetical protein OG562_24390 [Streptomyces sp. NBC_01275]|uniref:hypothetical protein n=1 Tax=Streptomyces sp. NBC_01275 TaxID=2903807 RepID=UPI002257C050|nr:hypothetical protein [Streptomyces sp. NBC_01275]MCX4764043.1 hypothetical protein [Streptomyces sp. NBC_01275]